MKVKVASPLIMLFNKGKVQSIPVYIPLQI